ncbi:MAG TPA: putative porin [Candidatus Methylomirabilis sp.]|nr:putative porin [Candidatus Methylomirabilis sp.]
MYKKKAPLLGVVFLLLAFAAASVRADETQNLTELRQSLVNLVETLVQEGVLTREKADAILRKALAKPGTETPAAGQAPAALESTPLKPGEVRVPYVPEVVKEQIREQVRADVMVQAKQEHWGVPGALPEWLDRISWYGDIRLRWQKDSFAKSNAPFTYYNFQNINNKRTINLQPQDLFLNTTEDRERLRLRVRLGMTAKVNDETTATARIATGSLTNPVSTTQTLGNSLDPYQVVLDQGYLKYQSSSALTLWGGRMPNPWFSTDLVWADDLSFDGLAASVRPLQFGEATDAERAFDPFITVGMFPIQEVELSKNDKWLYAAQLGFDWALQDESRFKFGLAYYDYQHIVGQYQPVQDSHSLDYTAPQFLQKGNTLYLINNDTDPNAALYGLASDYKEVNATASLDLATFDPTRLILTADYVKNVGYDKDSILQRLNGASATNPIEPRTKGYQLKFTAGWPETDRPGRWQVFTAFRYLERDAVLDAFTDPDFHLGGTDTRGWILGGSYGLQDNVWLRLRYLTADPIDGPPLGVDVLQLDLNAKF